VDSLEELEPEDAVFIVGADELANLSSWKRPERVLELVRLAVATRPGTSDERAREVRLAFPDRILAFEMPAIPISSSEVRERVARGEDIAGLVPPRIAEEIARLGLYRGAE
jgi:nicotinate-nucleotide adenylyltransferase